MNSVIGAAEQLLPDEKSDAPVTTRKIAERAGIGVGSIYDYFSGKENIFKALILREIDKNMLVFERKLDDLDEKTISIEGFAEEFVDYFSDHFYSKKQFMLNLITALPRRFTTPLLVETRKVASKKLEESLSKRFKIAPENSSEQVEKYVFLIVNSFLENFHAFLQMEKMGLMDFDTFVRFEKMQATNLLKLVYREH